VAMEGYARKLARTFAFDWDRYRDVSKARPLGTFRLAMELVMGGKLEQISRNRCPYCGAQFSLKAGVVLHLNGGECSWRFWDDIELAVALCRELDKMIKEGETVKVCLKQKADSAVQASTFCLHFRSRGEALVFLREVIRTGRAVIPVELPKNVAAILSMAGATNGGAGGAT